MSSGPSGPIFVVLLILQVLNLHDLMEKELDRIDKLKENQDPGHQGADPPPTPPVHQLPSPPPVPPPPQNLEVPTSPISTQRISKHFPLTSPIMGNPRRVRFVDRENKNFPANCSFLNDSSVGDCEGVVRTSTPLKSQFKLTREHAVNESMLPTRMPAIEESHERSTLTEMLRERNTDSGLGHSAERTTCETTTAVKTCSDKVESTTKRQGTQNHSKVSPSTMNKLKRFAFVERPNTSQTKENNNLPESASSSSVHNEKENNEGSKHKLSGMLSNNRSHNESSEMDTPASQGNAHASSKLRRTHSGGQTTNVPDNTVQLERACTLLTHSRNTDNTSQMLRTGNTSNPRFTDNSPTGFSKLLSYCNKSSPLLNEGNLFNTASNEHKMTVGTGKNEKRHANVQTVKRKEQDTSIASSLFKLDNDDNLSDSDFEPDWNPLAKKKKL